MVALASTFSWKENEGLIRPNVNYLSLSLSPLSSLGTVFQEIFEDLSHFLKKDPLKVFSVY